MLLFFHSLELIEIKSKVYYQNKKCVCITRHLTIIMRIQSLLRWKSFGEMSLSDTRNPQPVREPGSVCLATCQGIKGGSKASRLIKESGTFQVEFPKEDLHSIHMVYCNHLSLGISIVIEHLTDKQSKVAGYIPVCHLEILAEDLNFRSGDVSSWGDQTQFSLFTRALFSYFQPWHWHRARFRSYFALFVEWGVNTVN